MVCTQCGTQNPAGSTNCFSCGRDISKSVAEPIQSAPVRKPASAEQIIGNVDINGTPLVISNTRISFGDQNLKCDEIVGIRYGIFKHYLNGIRTSRSYGVWLTDGDSSLLIECASAFASSATVEARYQATLSALYPAVIVPLLESFLANLSDGRGFQIATTTFDRNGLHRSNSYGAVHKGLLNAWVSMAGGKSVAEREQSYQHLSWGDFGGHSFSGGNIRLYSRNKSIWTEFSLRDTWNAVCLGPLLDFVHKKRTSDRNALRPQEGSSVDDALYAFVNACKRPNPDTLFITDHWIEPRLRSLRAHLSDPVTREQAQALCDAIDKRVALDTVIDWLTHRRYSWPVTDEERREADAVVIAGMARIKEQEESERQRRIEEGKQRQIATRGTFEGQMIAGVPIARIPDSVRKYPDFLTWWNEVGRLCPTDSQGWSTLSGRGVMWSRSEMVAPELWDALPAEEKELIEAWARSLPDGGMLD